MRRDVLARIFEWNNKAKRKPLVLMGVRQVGKTWLMDEFAKEAYPQNTVYVNPEKNLATLGRQAQTRFLPLCSRTVLSGPPTRHEGRI